MLDFKSVTINDKNKINKFIPDSCKQICDFSFGNIFSWGVAENTRIAEKDGFLFLRSRFNGVKSYAFPWGQGDITKALEILSADARERKAELSFYCLSEEQVEVLKSIYGERFAFEEQRDFFDYVYLSQKLSSLSGRKLHSKKNHVNSFLKKYNYTLEELNEGNLKECLAFSHAWHKNGPSNVRLDEEMVVIEKAFENYFQLGCCGVALRVDGDIVAYAMGEAMADGKTFCTHFEKANPDFSTAYAAVNKLFAEKLEKEFQYINREDDAGSEGLRKAKLSYKPEYIVQKYYGKIV
jgi:hypothetical protein